MTSSPHISVIIPTYNRAEMLRAALRSVLDQTLPVHEIVVVDDGSTDHTPGMIARLKREGAPIIYLQEPHSNRLGELRNKSTRASSGSILAFLDSDDVWQSRRLEKQLAAWEKAPEAGLAFCNVQRFDENGPFPGGPYLPPTADYNGWILSSLLEEPVIVPSALMVRREEFDRVGGFPVRRTNEDYDLILRLAAITPACYVAEPLVLMRAHAGSRSRARNEMAMHEYLAIVGSFMASHPDLPPNTQARARRGMANVHHKLARHYIDLGDRQKARHHIAALLKLRPLDRRALPAYLRTFSPRQVER